MLQQRDGGQILEGLAGYWLEEKCNGIRTWFRVGKMVLSRLIGFIIEVSKPDPEKILAVLEWQVPTCRKQLVFLSSLIFIDVLLRIVVALLTHLPDSLPPTFL